MRYLVAGPEFSVEPQNNLFLRMRNVGFCGVDEITNTLGVIEDLERLSVSADNRVPRDNNNGDLQHSFSSAADEVFA